MRIIYSFTFIFLILFSHIAQSVIEIGVSGNYRRTHIDNKSHDLYHAWSGSISYYLNEASAIELTYSSGENRRSLSSGDPNGHLTRLSYSLIGIDFVYTFGERSSVFRPYVKAGTNYIIQKKISDQFWDAAGNPFPESSAEEQPGFVPSLGLGFRLLLTNRLSLRFGADAWISRTDSTSTSNLVDHAFRLGLSLYL